MKLLILSTLLVCGCNQQPQAVAPWSAVRSNPPPGFCIVVDEAGQFFVKDKDGFVYELSQHKTKEAALEWAWGLAFQIRIPPKSAVIGSLKEVQCSNGVK
jgi:hypothetical protein